jgi:hypothetical protein
MKTALPNPAHRLAWQITSKGESSADPPDEQPIRDDLIVNPKTANAIGSSGH